MGGSGGGGGGDCKTEVGGRQETIKVLPLKCFGWGGILKFSKVVRWSHLLLLIRPLRKFVSEEGRKAGLSLNCMGQNRIVNLFGLK